MTVKLAPASSDHRCWITAELQSYLAELSQFASIEKNAEGQYNYPYLDFYWREPDRHPFIIYLNNEAAGFLLVREDLDPADGTSITEIAELYILPAFRERSVASSAIKKALGFFPGNWRAAVLPNNEVGRSFWKQLISVLDPNFTVAPAALPKNQQVVFSFTA